MSVAPMNADLMINLLSHCKLSFYDEDGDEVLLDDFDSLSEALKVAKTKQKLAINLEWKENTRMEQKSAIKESIRQAKLKHIFKRMDIKTSDNWADKACWYCAVKLDTQNAPVFHVCLEKKCINLFFCCDCIDKHPADHVTLKMPHLLGDRPDKFASRAYMLMQMTRRTKEGKREAKLLSKNIHLNGDHLKLLFGIEYVGPAKHNMLQLQFVESQHKPVNPVVSLGLTKRKTKRIVECELILSKKLIGKSKNSSFAVESKWLLFKVNNDGSRSEILTINDSTPILVYNVGQKDSRDLLVTCMQPAEELHVESDLAQSPSKTNPSIDNDSICSLNSELSFQGAENGEEYSEMFASAVVDHDYASEVTGKEEAESYVVGNASLISALSEDSDVEVVQISEDEDANADEAPRNLDEVQEDELHADDAISEISRYEEVGAVENDTGIIIESSKFSEPSVLTVLDLESTKCEKPASLAVCSETSEKSCCATVSPLIDGSTSEASEVLNMEAKEQIPSPQELSHDSTVNSHDKFAEFMSKLLRSTSHAFENVSVASSQAFAAVNDAIEALQNVSSNSRTPETPLPKFYGSGSNYRQNASGEVIPAPNLHHVAWVPKSTQTTRTWNKQPEAREIKKAAEKEKILSKSDKDLCEIVRKNRILNELGFMDGAKNAQLLIALKGDLDSVIDALLNFETDA